MSRNALNTIALSFSLDHNPKVKLEIIDRTTAALAAFGKTQIFRLKFNSNAIVLTSCPPDQISVRKKLGLILHGTHALSRDGKAVDAAGLLARFSSGDKACFDALEPPFLLFAGSHSEVRVESDRIGLAHLFSWQGKTCSAIATSATLIAKIFDCPFCHHGLFQHMTVGHRLGRTTAFDGVQSVPAGARVSIRDGKLSFESQPRLTPGVQHDPVKDGRRVIASAVARCLEANPDCAIELSGGLDSRMALAAIPKDLRTGRTAYTIGYDNTPDVDVARDIAGKCGLEHVFVDLAQFKDESSDTTWKRARRIGYRDDFSTNILDRLAIDCVDDILLNRARIGGVNGELARGFYYAAFPVTSPVTEKNIDRLIAWRLTTNDAAPRELFDPVALRSCNTHLRAIVSAELIAGPQPLGNALDQFYLNQRMRIWAGSAITRAISNRMVFAPFFHSDYIAWAMSLPVNLKKDSKAFCSVLTDLDPDLAGMMLDSMLIPNQLASGGAVAQVALLRTKAMKLKLKLMQRLARARQTSLGANQFQAKLCRREIVDQLDWTRLETIGLFDKRGLEKLREGAIPWSRVTLGYLFALHFQLDYLAQRRRNEKPRVVDMM